MIGVLWSFVSRPFSHGTILQPIKVGVRTSHRHSGWKLMYCTVTILIRCWHHGRWNRYVVIGTVEIYRLLDAKIFPRRPGFTIFYLPVLFESKFSTRLTSFMIHEIYYSDIHLELLSEDSCCKTVFSALVSFSTAFRMPWKPTRSRCSPTLVDWCGRFSRSARMPKSTQLDVVHFSEPRLLLNA